MAFAELAALAIHDVKNRLAILAAHAEARQDRPAVLGLHQAAAELTRLLLLYKAEKGGLAANVDAGVPADVVNDLAGEMSAQTELRIVADAGEAPTLWFYDEHLVRMVLLNAVYNALRHARREIRLSARADGDWLEFSVRDDGPGFPPHLLGQLPAMGQLSAEGTGLGLYLAAQVAALHANAGQSGQICLENDGTGAVFTLRLPK